jgi:hypothetical protein
MSAFDGSTFLSGSTIDANELTVIHNKLPMRPESASASLVSANSTTYVDANSKTIAVEADDYIIWTVNFVYSVDDTTCVGGVRLLADGVTIGVEYPLRDLTNGSILASNGLVTPVSLTVHVFDMTAGARDFKFQVRRTSGSGTIYVGNSYAWFAVGKRKS